MNTLNRLWLNIIPFASIQYCIGRHEKWILLLVASCWILFCFPLEMFLNKIQRIWRVWMANTNKKTHNFNRIQLIHLRWSSLAPSVQVTQQRLEICLYASRIGMFFCEATIKCIDLICWRDLWIHFYAKFKSICFPQQIECIHLFYQKQLLNQFYGDFLFVASQQSLNLENGRSIEPTGMWMGCEAVRDLFELSIIWAITCSRQDKIKS